MTDEQLHLRMINKRIIAFAVFLLFVTAELLYYWYANGDVVKFYQSQKREEASLQSELISAENLNNQMRDTIEQTGKELVSFSEDKLKYINLASSLSDKHSVTIDKLSVSDVWSEGAMAGMTTEIQFQGKLSNVKNFINDYCSTNYTNRITVVSLKPMERYPWLSRSIDGKIVLDWFDLEYEQYLQKGSDADAKRKLTEELYEAGMLDQVPSEEEEEVPISTAQMFSEKTYTVYMKIDFLGRS